MPNTLTTATAFGPELKRRRKEKELSQEKLAGRCSLSTSFIGLMEKNLRQPTLLTLFALAEGLEIKASELVIAIEDDSEYQDL